MKTVKGKAIVFLLALLICMNNVSIVLAAGVKTLRPRFTTTWYWLNSAPQKEWSKDFQDIKELGFESIALWYGWDASLVASEIARTKAALDLCRKIGLKAYLGIWSGSIMGQKSGDSLNKYRYVNERGLTIREFNIFDESWINNWLKPYLEKIHSSYGFHPALEGYYLDDTLAIDEGTKYVSYGDKDIKRFRGWLKKKYKKLSALNRVWDSSLVSWKQVMPPKDEKNRKIWNDWNDVRSEWIGKWAALINRKLKQDDGKKLVFSDFYTVIDGKTQSIGLEWPKIIPYFDRIMVYNINISDRGLISKKIHKLKIFTNDQIPISWGLFTFIIGGTRDDKEPTRDQLTEQINEAISSGASGIDFYAYRVGDWTIPIAEIKNILLGPENSAALLKYRTDLHPFIKSLR